MQRIKYTWRNPSTGWADLHGGQQKESHLARCATAVGEADGMIGNCFLTFLGYRFF
jgi:hypothetical protein